MLFGAAALGGMRQEKADQVLELLLEYGVNHIDTAASYGDSELRIGPWMGAPPRALLPRHQDRRAHLRGRPGEHGAARSSGCGSTQLDLIQLHNLVDEDGWQHGVRVPAARWRR